MFLAFCFRSLRTSRFPPASSCDHEKLYHTNGHEVDSHLQQVGRKYFCDCIPPKITYWARLQSSQDHFVDPINLVSDSSGDSPPTIKKRRVMQRDVTIAITNEFLASPSRFGRNVRHVDTSGKPQFTAIEECVISVNESRTVYQRFEESERVADSTRFQLHSLDAPKKTNF